MASVELEEIVAQTGKIGNGQVERNTALLKQMPLFASVPEEAIRALAMVTKQDTFAANKPIFQDGDLGYEVFFVCSGEVEIYLTNAEKTKITLEIEKAGDFFGEVGALQGNRRTATAHVLQTAVALVVTGENLKAVLSRHPDIMLAMYAQTARRLGRTSVNLRRTTVTDPLKKYREQMSAGERQVSAIAKFCGSLKILVVNTAFVAVWAAIVLALGKNPLDGVLFNALSLLLALEALVITCIVLYSQNLQEDRESFIKEQETQANIRTEGMVRTLDEKLHNLRTELLQRLPEAGNTAAVVVAREKEDDTP